MFIYVWFIATLSDNNQDTDNSGDNNGDNNGEINGDSSGDRYVYDVNDSNINIRNEDENKTDNISNCADTITKKTTTTTVSSSSLDLQPLSSELR